MQGLMRQTAAKPIKKRIQHCMPDHIDANLRKKVEKELVNLDVDRVEEISQGASTFFAWVCLALLAFVYVAYLNL